jgi:hypothetical protein
MKLGFQLLTFLGLNHLAGELNIQFRKLNVVIKIIAEICYLIFILNSVAISLILSPSSILQKKLLFYKIIESYLADVTVH